jgi:hypothetical protein
VFSRVSLRPKEVELMLAENQIEQSEKLTEQFIKKLACYLEKKIELTGQTVNGSHLNNRYCVFNPPQYFSAIGIEAYLMRMRSYSCGSINYESYIAMLIYMDLYFSSITPPSVGFLSASNVYMMIIVGLLLANKYSNDHAFVSEIVFFDAEDEGYDYNRWMARMGGVHVQRINQLEAIFLEKVDYRLYYTLEQFNHYEDQVLGIDLELEYESMWIFDMDV